MVVGPTKQQVLELLYYHFTVDSPTREGKDPDLIPGYRLPTPQFRANDLSHLLLCCTRSSWLQGTNPGPEQRTEMTGFPNCDEVRYEWILNPKILMWDSLFLALICLPQPALFLDGFLSLEQHEPCMVLKTYGPGKSQTLTHHSHSNSLEVSG